MPGVRILVVDDDRLLRQMVRDLLEIHGFEVFEAGDGTEGVAQASGPRPDLILLDVMLRGLSGFDICRKIRADPTLGDLQTILITVWDDPSVAITGDEAGATLTLQKPADPGTILAALARVLGQSPDPPRGRPGAGGASERRGAERGGESGGRAEDHDNGRGERPGVAKRGGMDATGQGGQGEGHRVSLARIAEARRPRGRVSHGGQKRT
jgi:DNA-binding response OmpR family regulator